MRWREQCNNAAGSHITSLSCCTDTNPNILSAASAENSTLSASRPNNNSNISLSSLVALISHTAAVSELSEAQSKSMSISSGSEPDEVEDETAASAAQLNKKKEQARQTAHQVEDQQGAEIAAWFNLEAEFVQQEERQHKEINP